MVHSRRNLEPVPLVLSLALAFLAACATPDDSDDGVDPTDEGPGPSLRERDNVSGPSGRDNGPSGPAATPETPDPGETPADPTEPTNPDPVDPDPVEPEPTNPDPTDPGPVDPDPTEPDPADFGATGEACLFDSDCQVGILSDTRCFTDEQGWPDGYCTGFGCISDDDCGTDSLCTGDAVDPGMCVRTCGSDCGRFGYDCLPTDTAGLCLPPLPDPFLDAPNLGAPCTINDQCTMGNGLDSAPYPVCLPPRWPDGAEGLPDGYCAAIDCSLDGFDCGDNGVCVLFPEDPADPADDDLYLCLEWCPEIDTPSTCRAGYFCFDDGVGQGVCFPE